MDYKALQFMEEVDGKWTKPRSVSFNTSFYRQDAPFIAPDGKYLFYMRRDCVMWVSTQIIEELRPK
jgi:hypothetical protein